MKRPIIKKDPVLTILTYIGRMHHSAPVPLHEQFIHGLTILLNSTEYPDMLAATRPALDWYGCGQVFDLTNNSAKAYGIELSFEFTPHVDPGHMVYFETSTYIPTRNYRELSLHWMVWSRTIESDILGPFGPRLFVTVANIQRRPGMITLDKDLLFQIAGTGVPFVIIQGPRFSPFAYSVAVPEDRYIEYLFKVLSLETAVRFASDHISEKLEDNVDRMIKKALVKEPSPEETTEWAGAWPIKNKEDDNN